jgi:hypothetical protein
VGVSDDDSEGQKIATAASVVPTAGKYTVKTVPVPGTLSTDTCPPDCLMIP